MNIAIDIGHAHNTGARGNGLEEHAVATTIADHLAPMLRAQGHKVTIIDYPGKSNREDLNATIRTANAGGYDIGISIHCDSSDNSDARGGHVCFYPGSLKGTRLAASIAGPLTKLLPGRANAIQARPGLAILKQTRPAWVLCECGFITNSHDAALMRDNPGAIARAIAQGVEDYINQ